MIKIGPVSDLVYGELTGEADLGVDPLDVVRRYGRPPSPGLDVVVPVTVPDTH